MIPSIQYRALKKVGTVRSKKKKKRGLAVGFGLGSFGRAKNRGKQKTEGSKKKHIWEENKQQ